MLILEKRPIIIRKLSIYWGIIGGSLLSGWLRSDVNQNFTRENRHFCILSWKDDYFTASLVFRNHMVGDVKWSFVSENQKIKSKNARICFDRYLGKLSTYWVYNVRSRVKTPPCGKLENNGGIPDNFQANLVIRLVLQATRSCKFYRSPQQ